MADMPEAIDVYPEMAQGHTVPSNLKREEGKGRFLARRLWLNMQFSRSLKSE